MNNMRTSLRILFIMMCMIVAYVPANAETCVTATHSVNYDCGDGTVAGGLPPAATATYGAGFTPTMLTDANCTPPEGYKQLGIEIWVDGKNIGGYATTANAFEYYYASDMTIRPHYVVGSADDPSISAQTLWTSRGVNGGRYGYDAGGLTWWVDFPYGTVRGVAACSPQRPQNMAWGLYTGYLADDQDAITDKQKEGQYCYCKMTEPYFPNSPWLFRDNDRSLEECLQYCARYCADNLSGSAIFRGAVFRGARP